MWANWFLLHIFFKTQFTFVNVDIWKKNISSSEYQRSFLLTYFSWVLWNVPQKFLYSCILVYLMAVLGIFSNQTEKSLIIHSDTLVKSLRYQIYVSKLVKHWIFSTQSRILKYYKYQSYTRNSFRSVLTLWYSILIIFLLINFHLILFARF